MRGGNLKGHLTYVVSHGRSTVNLVLASETSLTTLTIVHYHSIQDLNFLSDPSQTKQLISDPSQTKQLMIPRFAN